MDRINELLDKYFQGTSTLNEEKELRQYFNSEKVASIHQPYIPLFKAFDEEAAEKLPTTKHIQLKPTHKRLWVQISAFSGIAATLLLCVWMFGLQDRQPSNNFALVNPPRNEDNEFARKYTREKLERVNEILNSSMKPVRSLDKIRNGIRPINKISETRDKLQEIQTKLQIK